MAIPTAAMPARIANPLHLFPQALPSLFALAASTRDAGLPRSTSLFAKLRASQITECEFCIVKHGDELRELGESEQRIAALSSWREQQCFSDAERAALALADAITVLPPDSDPIWDGVWSDAAKHYDEPALAALVLDVAVMGFSNRIFVATRQPVEPSTQRGDGR
jgi:AhpD family alkylhydroperoxidase